MLLSNKSERVCVSCVALDAEKDAETIGSMSERAREQASQPASQSVSGVRARGCNAWWSDFSCNLMITSSGTDFQSDLRLWRRRRRWWHHHQRAGIIQPTHGIANDRSVYFNHHHHHHQPPTTEQRRQRHSQKQETPLRRRFHPQRRFSH